MPYADATFDLTVSLLVHPFETELYRVLARGRLGALLLPDGARHADLVPDRLVAPRLERAGFAEVRSGVVGPGEWTAGRR